MKKKRKIGGYTAQDLTRIMRGYQNTLNRLNEKYNFNVEQQGTVGEKLQYRMCTIKINELRNKLYSFC